MSATTDFERTLTIWLERTGPDDVPERVVTAALAGARTVRQRPAWLTTTRWTFREDTPMKAIDVNDDVARAPTGASRLRLAWVVVTVAALLALVGGLLVVGSGRDRSIPVVSDTSPSPVPTARPEPTEPRHLLAVSREEAWAVDAAGLWHFLDEAWRGPISTPGPADDWTDLAVDNDGTLWLAGVAGVWTLDGGRWTSRLRDGSWRVVRATDRGVWASTQRHPFHLLAEGDQTTRLNALCPSRGWLGNLQLAVTGTGAIGAAGGYGPQPGLWAIDDQGCERVYPLDDGVDYLAGGLASDPRGGVVAALYQPTENPDFSVDAHAIVRYDGNGWSVLAEDVGSPWDVTGPDGERWRLLWRSIVPLDGLTIDPLGDTPISVAPDGTVWYVDASGIQRVAPR